MDSKTVNEKQKEEIEELYEADSEEDEDEEEEEDDVILGFVEKPKKSYSLVRHMFPSKAGGVPAWLDPVNLPSGKACNCGFCGEPLQFLLQIYASLDDNESAFHRMLYVFMCPSMSCLLCDQHEQWKPNEQNPCRSVKVFRCQLPRSNAFYSSKPPSGDGTDKPLTAGAPLCSWCGTWKGDKVCASCRKARYCSEKHQAIHWKSGHKNKCRQLLSQPETSSLEHNSVPASSLWPEYEILIDDESAYRVEDPEDNNGLTSLVPKKSNTDETSQLWSEKFAADADKLCWASFQERISKAPSQVLRYWRDEKAKPFWPLSVGQPSIANIPKCDYCKGPLCYEFQIMPQMLYYMGVKNEPDSLDWGTIAVYTCLASCQSNISYKEEFVWVQLYPSDKF